MMAQHMNITCVQTVDKYINVWLLWLTAQFRCAPLCIQYIISMRKCKCLHKVTWILHELMFSCNVMEMKHWDNIRDMRAHSYSWDECWHLNTFEIRISVCLLYPLMTHEEMQSYTPESPALGSRTSKSMTIWSRNYTQSHTLIQQRWHNPFGNLKMAVQDINLTLKPHEDRWELKSSHGDLSKISSFLFVFQYHQLGTNIAGRNAVCLNTTITGVSGKEE